MPRVTFIQTDHKDAPKRHYGIKCLDCRQLLGSKSEAVKKHKGHEVRYLNADGSHE